MKNKKGSNKKAYLITVPLAVCLLRTVCLYICHVSNENVYFMLPKRVVDCVIFFHISNKHQCHKKSKARGKKKPKAVKGA